MMSHTNWKLEMGVYSVTLAPTVATAPLTLAWSNGARGPTAFFSWTVTGDKMSSSLAPTAAAASA